MRLALGAQAEKALGVVGVGLRAAQRSPSLRLRWVSYAPRCFRGKPARGRIHQASQGERQPYQDSSDGSPNVMGMLVPACDRCSTPFGTEICMMPPISYRIVAGREGRTKVNWRLCMQLGAGIYDLLLDASSRSQAAQYVGQAPRDRDCYRAWHHE